MKIFSKINAIDIGQLIFDEAVLVGLDVGDKTVGVAVSDRRIRISSGITTVHRKSLASDFAKLESALIRYKVGVIVFGWPVQMNGIPGSQCEKVVKFAEELRSHFTVPFVCWDERLSTCAVNSVMIQADMSRKKRKKFVDKNAATYILQCAIDFLNTRAKDYQGIESQYIP